jgi:hypothetical protein
MILICLLILFFYLICEYGLDNFDLYRISIFNRESNHNLSLYNNFIFSDGKNHQDCLSSHAGLSPGILYLFHHRAPAKRSLDLFLRFDDSQDLSHTDTGLHPSLHLQHIKILRPHWQPHLSLRDSHSYFFKS